VLCCVMLCLTHTEAKSSIVSRSIPALKLLFGAPVPSLLHTPTKLLNPINNSSPFNFSCLPSLLSPYLKPPLVTVSNFQGCNWMGSNEGDENGGSNKSRWLTKPSCWCVLFMSLLVSIAGGLVLGWWLHKYHPSNTQLWMVPFGFLLFLTPLIICLALVLPDLCVATARIDQEQPSTTQDHSLSRPNR